MNTLQISAAAKSILKAMQTQEGQIHQGEVKELIEASEALNFFYDYKLVSNSKTWEFIAWDLHDEEKKAHIIVQ